MDSPPLRWVPGGPTLGSSVAGLTPLPVGFPPSTTDQPCGQQRAPQAAEGTLSLGRTDAWLQVGGAQGAGAVHLGQLLQAQQVLQALLGGPPQARLPAGGEPDDLSLQVWIQQRRAQQEQHLLLQQHRLQEAQRVETHLPVCICEV
ncbi:hypothetical protein EYF80_046865 [Liparis tanakae]|uniref:Uncharacterized protein n=1 Tax=Liparis tanakae TaxID=230148 RepID=A0A4Z2FQF5_9TELE|nr:hypothetical protein EYF80_046865 [Liparis tanakae]